MVVILSCGIPTSMPILPKEVVVKASPSVSMPLGKVNYNLYSGINGGNMEGKLGSLDNLLGDAWLQDLLDQGAKIYDYRPAGTEDDPTQKFLIHYKLNMEDTTGGGGDFDLSEYRDMIDELTGDPTKIDDVSFEVPSVDMTEPFTVEIPLNQVTAQIFTNINSMKPYFAYLPVANGVKDYKFPDQISTLQENSGRDFSVTLSNMDSLTLKDGKLNFKFILSYSSSLQQGATLTLSNFTLRGAGIENVPGSKDTVDLTFHGDTGTASISFKDSKLPQKFELVCDLKITGTGDSFFNLQIEPSFEAFTISGVEGLALNRTQLASLKYDFPRTTHPIGGNLGPSFQALVETGNLEIDAAAIFPSLDTASATDEGWNLTMNLSELYIRQGAPPGYSSSKGLSLGGPSKPVKSGDNDLYGEILNNQPVVINGKVTMVIAGGGNKLSFRNFPGGIKKDDTNVSYKKQLDVNMEVSLFSTVTVLAKDFGLDKIDQVIERELGDDFTSFKPWLNYMQFAEGGLGTVLSIEKLSIAGGMGLYVDAPVFGLHHAFRPLENLTDPETEEVQENARLVYTNKDDYRILGTDLPDNGEKLRITVKLGLEDEAAQKKYEQTGLLTIKDVIPGNDIELTNIEAGLVFDWAVMSVKPKPHESGSDDPLPDYPFKGTYPDKDKGEEGIDMSGFPAGLIFQVPDRGGEDEGGMSGSLYIGLKRQKLVDEAWVDDDADDPEGDDYDETDPYGWRRNLSINLPSLDFRVRYGDNAGDVSENLFDYNPNEEKDTGEWALSRPLDLEDPDLVDQEFVKEDDENAANPFKIYSSPSLPELDKAIPIGNLAEVFNKNLIGEKDRYFEYTVELSSLPDNEDGSREPGEILLYPDMLEKRMLISVDLLMVVPLKFTALQTDPDPSVPVVVTIAPDLGDEDLFGRMGPDDNEFFDLVKSLGFDINIKNLAGLSAGRFFLESKTSGGPGYYRTSMPIVDFSRPRNKFSLGDEELEEIKTIWPFVPRVSIEFEAGKEVRIERNFNIELQSITIKAGGEYTFETGW
jgi:hypothetical protein